MPDWRAVLDSMPSCEPRPPATEAELRRVEADLDVTLPPDLRELYLSTNGIRVQGFEDIWPLDRVTTNNRRDPHPWLIAFGDNGCGEPFCVRRDGGSGIFYYYPIGGEVTRLADTLLEFWIGWNDGSIVT